ncbi:MAG: SAM-dependent methyltransferase [Candidatus Promineifilaceae bacterium]
MMPLPSFIDASKPNAGRIYDYLLGGSHNFDVDRIVGERVRQVVPFLPKAMRLQRWCLQDLAAELTSVRQYDVIIDFASGLPTSDHIHHVVRPGSTVIYSDYDPVVVEYAHELLAGAENTYYFLADASQPEELLNRQEVLALVGDSRNVAIIFWGISGFLTDEELRSTLEYLYQWSGPNACLCFNAHGADINASAPSIVQLAKIYEQMGSKIFIRTLQVYQSLLQPWQPDEKGFCSLLEWHGMNEEEMTEDDRQSWGLSGGGYGVYLVK